MKTKRQIPGWMIFILALIVAVVAVITISTLRQHADESHQSEILLSRLEVLSSQLNALGWRFEHSPDPKTLEEVQVIENQIAQTLDGLMRLDPGDERLQQLSKAQLEFETSMDETFRLIAAGDLEKADVIDRKQVDVNFEMLNKLIASASAAYSERAHQAQMASNRGTTFVVIVAGMMIGILSLQFQKTQMETKLIAAEQEALSKAHNELEVRVQERTEELAKTNKALNAEIIEREQIEQELQKRESFLANIFTSIQDGIGIIDKDLNIIRVNPTAERWYPHSAPFAGKKCYEAFHSRKERCEVCPAWQTLKTGESAYEVVPKNGPGGENVGWLEIYSFPMIDTVTEQMRGAIEYVRDITRRKQAEKALEEAVVKAENEKNKSNAIIAAIGDGIIIQDTDYKIIYQNQIQNDLYGDHVGEYCYKAYEGRDTICEGCPVELAFKDGNIHRAERSMPTDKGTLHAELTGSPLRDSTGKIIAGIKVIRDITERKRIEDELRKAHDGLEIRVHERTAELTKANEALQVEIAERMRTEESLKQSEEKYHTLVDNIQDGVFIIQDTKMQFANEAFARIAGYTVAEIIGKDFRELIAPEDLDRVVDYYYRRQAGEDVPKEYEFRMLSKDGTRAVVNINVGIITYRGKVASMGTLKDITDKKKLEAQLLRAQRMESIGTLAGGIAHDLNNVLTPIMLSLQILQDKFTDEPSHRLLDILETNTQRGANLIKQVMSFARGIGGEHTALQIQDITAEIEKIAKETFPRSIKILTDIPEDLFTISGDATQLHQVLMNLCVNARDAMPDGGTLRIYAQNISLDENYVRMNIDARVGLYVIISVSDTGTGIAPEIQSRIFEPFFTTKEFGKGTGLGLSTALGIIKGHGGFIDVYSEVGKGTAFKVYLPALKIIATQKAEIQQYETPGGQGELIFVVDDEVKILEITRSILEKNGYRVLTASDGAEAIRLYSQNIEEIKVVLMDMMMPIMDGPSSIQALRQINPEIKIIGVSGLIEREKFTNVTDTNVHAFLTKPYTVQKLLRTIYEVIVWPA